MKSRFPWSITLVVAVATVAFTGCLGTLIPKKVELFQDKVKAFPEPSPALRELERQTIYAAHEKATETVVAALQTQASAEVVTPAQDTVKLTEAAVVAAGPPEKVSQLPAEVLAVSLENSVGKHNTKVDKFAKGNDENVGKKIEGTGLIQVPYLLWAGGAVVLAVVVFFVGKLALTAFATANPGAAVGLNVVNAAQSVIAKGFAQVVKGGEDFKTWVESEITDSGLKDKILTAFQSAHKSVQDQDVQNTIKAITS